DGGWRLQALALRRLQRPEADVVLAWVWSDRTAGGGLCTHLRRRLWLLQVRSHERGHARRLRRLTPRRRMHRRGAAWGLWARAEGSDPQEARHEHEACRGGEAQPPQREWPRARGRGQDLLD